MQSIDLAGQKGVEFMMGKTCWIMMILAGIFVGTAFASYSFQPTNLKNSSGLNHTRINDSAIDKESVQAAMLKLPLSFIENVGQVSNEARFTVKTSQATIYFTQSEALFALASKNNTSIVRMGFEDGKTNRLVGEEPLPGRANFIIGNNSSRWITDVPTYGSVRYISLYPGVDLVFKGTEGNLKHELVLSPGVDPAGIVLVYDGQDNLSLEKDGSVLIRTAAGTITDAAPVCYQNINGSRIDVEGRYRRIDSSRIGFEIKNYNQSLPLVIDPTLLIYSTYLGGGLSDYSSSYTNGIAVDGCGNAYITGNTEYYGFPTQNAYQPTFAGGNYDAFVTKLSPAGNELVYSTYLGGSGTEYGQGIAIDGNGNAYVTGYTDSNNFPTKNAYQSTFAGGQDAFVTKLGPGGNALVYSTYLGGSTNLGGTGYEHGNGIAVDDSGSAYVTGNTGSNDFPTLNAYQPTSNGNYDAFVTKFSPAGNELVYSTYLGGTSYDYSNVIAVDGRGNAYVTGITGSNDFPTLNAYQPTYNGGTDAFVTKFSPAGNELVYSTYLGGTDVEYGNGIAVDDSGNAYVAGYTKSTDFPTQNAYQKTNNGSYDVFVTKFSPAGNALVYSTYLGGTSYDWGFGIAVDGSGNAYITGETSSADFPTQNAYQKTYNGSWDAFVTKFSPAGNALVYSTYLSGTNWDSGFSIAVDGSRNAYVAGGTASADFPTKNAYQTAKKGYTDVIIAKIGSDPEITTQPIDVTCCLGSEASFSVTASGAGPLSYQWKKNGDDLADEAGHISGATTSSLTISPVAGGDAASYSVVVTGECGTVTSTEATLTVGMPPTLITQSESEKPIEACEGKSVSFSVEAIDALYYQWMKNGTPIEGAVWHKYTIPNVGTDDTGSYKVVASNCCGSEESNSVQLTVISPPRIIDQRINQRVRVGQAASLRVTAAGSEPLSYVWTKNGQTIPGATSNTYTIPKVTLRDAGKYCVVVSNSCGKESTCGTLTVSFWL